MDGSLYTLQFVSDIAIFVLKRDVKLQLTNYTLQWAAPSPLKIAHSHGGPRPHLIHGFYSAVLATAIPSVRLPVCPSVTRRYCVKTVARSTVQFAPLDSKMCLVL